MYSIFKKDNSVEDPYEGWAVEWMRKIWHGFWTDAEFSFNSDIHDFKTKLTEQERGVIIRAISAIANIENRVKLRWSNLHQTLPWDSIANLGLTMGGNEVIHAMAYKKLLKVLGLEQIWKDNENEPCIKRRIAYLQKHLQNHYKDKEKQFLYSIALFTLFVEHVSLFSQFYIIMWFWRYRNVLKDTSQQVNYTKNEECFKPGTQALTPKGWKNIEDFNIGDSIYQYNEDGTISSTHVLHTVSNDFNGELIEFSRCGNKCVVTPNHDMIYYNTNKKLTRRKAKDMKLHKQIHIPVGGVYSNTGINELSFEDRLRIAIQADGTNLYWRDSNDEKLLRGKNGGRTHSIGIKKDRKKERLDWILSNLNVDYTVANTDDGHSVYRIKYNHDVNYKNLNEWVNLEDKTSEWCAEFIDEVIRWDGYNEANHSGYCSTIKSNIDTVQTIAILAGFSTNIYKANESARKSTYNDCYKLSIKKCNLIPKSHGVSKDFVPYEGKVHCITVPSGNIITRIDDKTFITGNCVHSLIGVDIINKIKEEHSEFWDEELRQKILDESHEAISSEENIIDWILGDYSGPRLSADVLKSFVRQRMNEGLEMIGLPSSYQIDDGYARDFEWFYEEVLGNNHTDFFVQRPVDYAKKLYSVSYDELFEGINLED
jgi:ribonucleotide reductase beta subunit family protein with ferritin-like domain